MIAGLTPTVALILLLRAVISLSTCPEVSPAFGQYYQGRALMVSVINIERTPELRYAASDGEQGLRYMKIAPSGPDLELVVVRLKVQNHTATSAIINVNKQGAELRDFNSEKYFPVEINDRIEPADGPPGKGDRSAQILELQKDSTFAPSRGFISGPFELNKGTGLDGWMVFEAPRETKFRTFRWLAGDSLTIDLSWTLPDWIGWFPIYGNCIR